MRLPGNRPDGRKRKSELFPHFRAWIFGSFGTSCKHFCISPSNLRVNILIFSQSAKGV